MNLMKKNLFLITLSLFLIVVPFFNFAYGDTPPPCNPADGKICNPLANVDGKEVDTIPKFIKILLEGALKIGMPVIALAVIYCGFLFVEAQGNPEKLGKAKDALFYTLIGAGILLGSWAIAEMISATVTGIEAAAT